MEKFTPYEKLSKKRKRAMDAQRRETWAISPVTRQRGNGFVIFPERGGGNLLKASAIREHRAYEACPSI